MAIGFEVSGPTLIRIRMPNETSTWDSLGYTPNDDTLSLDVSSDPLPVHSSRAGGYMPANWIHRGVMGVIPISMVDWDPDVMDELIGWAYPTSGTGGTANGHHGQAGRLYLDNLRTSDLMEAVFGVEIYPAFFGLPGTTGNQKFAGYTMERCLLIGNNSHQYMKFGNLGRIESLLFTVVPDKNGDLYTQFAAVSGGVSAGGGVATR